MDWRRGCQRVYIYEFVDAKRVSGCSKVYSLNACVTMNWMQYTMRQCCLHMLTYCVF